jgi:hypothetical protein
MSLSIPLLAAQDPPKTRRYPRPTSWPAATAVGGKHAKLVLERSNP